MAHAGRIQTLIKGSALVQDSEVVRNFHIAWFQVEGKMNSRIVTNGLQRIDGGSLCFAKSRNLVEALREINVVALMKDEQVITVPGKDW